MKKNIVVGIHNHFDIVSRDVKTNKVVRQERAYNLILDNFWNEFLQSDSDVDECLSHIYFGSGTTTPASSDTSMTAYEGGKSTTNMAWDYSNFKTTGVIKITGNIRLEASEYVGVSISEVGFGRTSTEGLCTKSLIKDQNGNPLSIIKLVDQVVDIFGTFYVRIPLTGAVRFTGYGFTSANILNRLTFQSSTSDFNVQFRNMEANEADGGVYDYKSVNIDNSVTYDPTNKKMTITLSDLSSSTGNIGGLKELCLLGDDSMAVMIAELPVTNFSQPAIIKESVGTGDGSNKKFSCAFGNVKDNGTAKLYVNDVEVDASFVYSIGALDLAQLGPALKVISFDPDSNIHPMILENVCNDMLSVTDVIGRRYIMYSSDDCETWTQILYGSNTTTGTKTIDIEHQNKRYYKIVDSYTTAYTRDISNLIGTGSIYHAIADSAPADGDAVTMTYEPNCIAKDSQHVIKNVQIELTFNEYTPS
ncbi:hypothetical protein JR334_02060 [Clostridia bacterium]|nr:hypothetical protein JR334_02060 [Clostridia bacterium]